MNKWTKGPWKVTYEAGDFDESVGVSMDSHQKNPMHYRSAHLWHSDCEPDDEETVANSTLIAESPSMIDALMQWRNAELSNDGQELDNARHERDRIIEKLTGDSK